MLIELHIRNFTIIKELTFTFEKGMTVLTGETGAGKSILIDAIQFGLGDRADSRLIRQGETRCEISLCFDVAAHPLVKTWLTEHEFNQAEDCLIRRTLNQEGRSRCYVNEHMVSLQRLKALAELLLTVHGQHHNQLLLDKNYQRQYVDHAVADAELVETVKEQYQHWQQLLKKDKELQEIQAAAAAKMDFLNYQLQELTALQLVSGELVDLENQQKQLAHTEQLLSDGQVALQKITGSMSEIFKAQILFEQLSKFAEPFKNWISLLENATISLQELQRELETYLEKLSHDPSELQQIEQRLGGIYGLARKYRVAPSALPELQSTLQQELEALNTLDEQKSQLDLQIQAAQSSYETSASQLSHQRLEVANRMAQQVQAYLPELNMVHAKFAIQLMPEAPSAYGLESVVFLISVNPGQPLRPLVEVISGGELSRLNLAIQAVFVKSQATPVLVFDEIDTGIGGGVASLVGQLMRLLSKKTQVIAITHLPQVAVKAQHHYVVRKESVDGNTYTTLSHLNEEERTVETARMLGGLKITERTIAHAKELLEG